MVQDRAGILSPTVGRILDHFFFGWSIFSIPMAGYLTFYILTVDKPVSLGTYYVLSTAAIYAIGSVALLDYLKKIGYLSELHKGVYTRIANSIVPESDLLVLHSGNGEMSALFHPMPISLTMPVMAKPDMPQLVDCVPGFIYIMRRDDGIYKFGRSVDPLKRRSEHIEEYRRNFEIIRLFAVPNMIAFEQLALRMTGSYAYRKEQGRKELRKIPRRQLVAFILEFEKVIKKATLQ